MINNKHTGGAETEGRMERGRRKGCMDEQEGRGRMVRAALFNWPLLITEGLCRPSPLLFTGRRLALGSICVYMDSGGVCSFLFIYLFLFGFSCSCSQ